MNDSSDGMLGKEGKRVNDQATTCPQDTNGAELSPGAAGVETRPH